MIVQMQSGTSRLYFFEDNKIIEYLEVLDIHGGSKGNEFLPSADITGTRLSYAH